MTRSPTRPPAARGDRRDIQARCQEATRLLYDGRGAEANALLVELLKRHPRDPEVLFYRGFLLLRQGEAMPAIPYLKRAAGLLPDQPEIQIELALAHDEAGEADKARRLLEKIVARWPQQADAWIHLGNRAALAGDHGTAAGHYEAALRAEPDHVGALLNIGHCYLETGRLEAAAQAYGKAVEKQPSLSSAHSGIGMVRQRQGDTAAAEAAFRAAIAAAAGRDAMAHANLAGLLRDRGRYDDAIDQFRAALAIHPTPGFHAGLATVLERAHRLAEAEQAVEAALALDPAQPEARLTLAKLRRRGDDPEAAATLYRGIIEDAREGRVAVPPAILARAESDLAHLLERRGDYDEAYRFFAAANATNCAGNPRWREQAQAYRAGVAALAEALEGLGPGFPDSRAAGWPDSGEPAAAPVFLVGFPRSGTTLMDQVLAGHSALRVMEEKTLLDGLAGELGADPAVRLEVLGRLDGEGRAVLRRRYLDLAGDQLGARLASGQRLVDKLPLNILNLWLIQGLFPDARVIVALRDPRDVCLSCFANLFRLDEGLAGFPSLEETARLYGAVMTVYQRSRQALPLACHELRYEALLDDFEGAARRLFGFLDLPWEAAVLDYRRTAQARSIVTPSYHQVIQPLYGHARGRWRHYAEALAPVLPVLAPFVAALGYDET